MLARLLDRFATWALSKNAPGPYKGEEDTRWAYTIETAGDKYLTRVLTPKIFGCRVYLHHFLRPDADRHLHNHPWKWAASFVLCGSYDEERLEPDALDALRLHQSQAGHEAFPTEFFSFVRRIRRFNILRDTDYHQVTKLHDDVWTLFITGPTVQDWGFLVDGVHVSWRKYLKKENV